MIKTPIVCCDEFKKLDDITKTIIVRFKLTLHKHDETHYLLFKLNYKSIDKFYKDIVTENIYPILMFSTVMFLVLSFIFYLLFVKPIQRINSKIIQNRLKKDNFILEELNYLDDTYISQIKEFKSLLYVDELTQIHNRKSYNERVSESISLYNRYKTPFSILMYDIDDFKHINDTYGHNIGDKVLIEMSNFIKILIRKNDHLFRVGGEEFIIILSDTNIEDGKSVSEKICKEVPKLQIVEGEEITISIGLTEVKDEDTEDSIYTRVDSLLYFSKKNGKNRVSTKIIGDLVYSYYFDEERNLMYEKIYGNFGTIEPFRETLMGEEFMKKYLSCEYVITDNRDFNMNFDHYKELVTEVFLGHKKTFEGKDIKTKKIATCIYKYDNVNSVKPFEDLQKSYGIDAQTFTTIDEISDFIGFDTQKYFNMTEKELTIHR